MVSIKENLSENFGNTVSSTFLFKLDLFLIHSVDYLFLIFNARIISLLPALLLSHTLTCLVMRISSPRWSLKNLHLQDAAYSFTSLMMSSGWSAWHLAGMVLVLTRCSWFPFLRMGALCLDAQLSFYMNSWILHLSDFGSKLITLLWVFCCYFSLPIPIPALSRAYASISPFPFWYLLWFPFMLWKWW